MDNLNLLWGIGFLFVMVVALAIVSVLEHSHNRENPTMISDLIYSSYEYKSENERANAFYKRWQESEEKLAILQEALLNYAWKNNKESSKEYISRIDKLGHGNIASKALEKTGMDRYVLYEKVGEEWKRIED